MNHNFKHLGGNTEISGSSAHEDGGAVLRSHDFEMAVGSGRSTLGSENRKEWKRFPSISTICHQCLRQSLIANWFSFVCTCVCPLYKQGVVWLFVFISVSEYVWCFRLDAR